MEKLNPQVVVWEYTLACDSKCIHCGSDAKYARKNELTTEESLDLVDQLADIGFKRIILSGGEPTLRKDWKDIAQRINDNDMRFGIISNALAWNQQTIEDIVLSTPFGVGFSVDGEEKLHDYLRGIEGSHKKVFSTIKKLRKYRVPSCAITSVNSQNLPELPAIRNRLIVYGVSAWQIQTVEPMGRMEDKPELILDDNEYMQLAEFIAETRERVPYMNVQGGDCIGYFGKLESRLRKTEWHGCGAGIETLGIDSDGKIRACLSIRSPKGIVGSIREQLLREIWENDDNFYFNRNFNVEDLGEKCAGCEYGTECRGGCQSQSTAFSDEFHNAPYCLHRMESGQK